MEPTKTDVPPKPSIRPPAELDEKPVYPTARLSQIQFGLLSNREAAHLSVITEKNARNRRVGITRGQDLFDPRLGVPCKEQKCATCNGTRRGACDRPGSCDGHFGHISLPVPIYHPHFVRQCLKILSSICLGCSRVLEKKKRKNVLDGVFETSSDEDEDSEGSAFEKSAPKRKVGASASNRKASRKRKRKRTENSEDLQRLMQGLEHRDVERGVVKQEWSDSHALDSSNLGLPHAPVCKLEPIEFGKSSIPGYVPDPSRVVSRTSKPSNYGQRVVCNYCGVSDGVKSQFPKIKLKLVGKTVGRRGRVESIQLVVDEKAGVLPEGFWDFVDGHPTNLDEKTRTLLPIEALKILKRIPIDDVGQLNMNKLVSRPDSFIVTKILISPNCNRLVMEDWSSTLQPRVLQRRNGQTNKLECIVRKAKQIGDALESTLASGQRSDFLEAEQDSEDLQLLAARHFRACKVVEYKMTTGKEVEETGGTLDSKWLKANVLGKRSNYIARSVINGDPFLSIEEVGIPKEIATILTVDEKVNALNIRRWQEFVDLYMVSDNKSMPGAFSVRTKNESSQRDLEFLRRKKTNLGVGDTITRCEIATIPTVDEKVNELNIRRWQEFVDLYMVSDNKSMPGAFRVRKKNESSQLDLEFLRSRKTSRFNLGVGDTIARCEIATIPTVDEKVNALNIRRWQEFVDLYMVSDNKSMPGAFSVRKKNESSQQDLEFLRSRKTSRFNLGVGDTITRCLRDGDRVFVNRPPSLHKHSLITLKVKVHALSTIAINPLICPPFEADFDGDAFHVFVPQSLESTAETEELMRVPAQLVSSQGGQPLIGLTQDSLVAGHLLTSGHVFLSKKDMQELSMWCSSTIPIPAVVKAPTRIGPLWTGKQLFSMTLPDGLAFGNLPWTGTPLGTTARKPINSPEGDVLIQDGELLICQGGAKWLDRSPIGVVRAICDHAGPVAALEHLDCLQAVLNQWLLIRGFSVGLRDFYAAEDAGARERMLRGVQKSLEKSNEASVKQALKLDRQVQDRSLSPKQGETSGGLYVEEHQGCFGLLLEDRKSNQRIAALQGAAIERFQTLAPNIENLVSGYMDKNNSLLAMVKSGSKGSMSKLTQQVGCVGLQLYKGERLLPVRSNNKLSYYQGSIERSKSCVFTQTKADAGQEGFWQSRGIIRSSYFDALNPTEFFLDSISSKCNVLRQGIEEPNLILKTLMLFLRDMKIEYDGTVRIGSGQSIIQFQYGPGKGCLLDKDPNLAERVCASSSVPLVADDLEEHWPDSKLAGEPVGALAATSISEPAYNVRMQSIHQAQALGTGPLQLLKEVLMIRAKTKLKLNDRRSILRLPQGFGKERRALEIQMQLQKITLEKITLISSIEFSKLDKKMYVKNEMDKEGLAKPFVRLSPWIGHIHLCKRTIDENKLNMNSIVERLNQKHSGGATDDIYFSFSAKCISDEVHPHSEGLCIWFFPVIIPESVASTKEVYGENLAPLLESMKASMLPAVLNTTIRGSDNIERVRIFWEDSGSASRLPRESISLGPQNVYQSKRYDPGELAIEVVMKAPKGAGKRGAAWNALKEACVPVMDMIDWSRSCPYATQEMYTSYGVEAARHNILKRLSLATKTMGKPVHQNHMILVADTMTHCGDVTGLGSAGYRDFCRQLSISAPFTEAAFQQPKKKFLDAAAGGASETMDGVLTSAVWGTRVPIGTGTAFQIKPQVPNIASHKWTGDPLELWEKIWEPKAVHTEGRSKSTHQNGFQLGKSTKSQTEFKKGNQTGTILQELEDLTATTIFQDGKLAGIMLGKGNARATIFQYDNKEEDEDLLEECEDGTRPAFQKAFRDGEQEDHESLQMSGKKTKRPAILQDDKHEGYNETGKEVVYGLRAPGIDNGDGTGCKRMLETLEEVAEIRDEPSSKLQKKRESPSVPQMESDIAVLRVNDPRRIIWSGCADVALPEEPKVDCIYDSYKLPHISSSEVSEENIAPASVKRMVNSVAKSISPSSGSDSKREPGDTSSVSSNRRLRFGGMTTIVKTLRNLFYSPNETDSDTHQQESRPDGSVDRKDDLEVAGGTSQSTREVLHESFEQQVTRLSPVKNSSVGPIQPEAASNNQYEELITEEKKELQHLLHIRYRVGERVQGDVEKMILEEVLVHHPQRGEKVGCGVDYIKVDYHPDHPTSKCFHIVRKDGSCSDFSYHKCLDRKLLKLCNSKQK